MYVLLNKLNFDFVSRYKLYKLSKKCLISLSQLLILMNFMLLGKSLVSNP